MVYMLNTVTPMEKKFPFPTKVASLAAELFWPDKDMCLCISLFSYGYCFGKHKRKRILEIQWKHLVVTDVRWAQSSTGFNQTVQELEELGVIIQDGVNAFDFMRCLAPSSNISPAAQRHGFDSIVMYGVKHTVCFGSGAIFPPLPLP